jgi:agmatinase
MSDTHPTTGSVDFAAVGSGAAMEGIPTFLSLPFVPPRTADLLSQNVRALFLGAPYEGGTISHIFRPGSGQGPRGMRLASTHLKHYNWELDTNIVDHYNLRDGGDIPVSPVDSQLTRDSIEFSVGEVLDAGAIPIVVGGDHSVSYPCAAAVAKRHARVGVLVIDSHLDSAEEAYGHRFTHASLYPRLVEHESIVPQNIAIVGQHGNSVRQKEVNWLREHDVKVYFQNEIWDRGIDAVVTDALDRVWDGVDAVYVSFDTDAVDAAYMPGTCSSEPGGLTARELLRAARLVGARGLTQLDVVELAPVWDPSQISARLAIYFIINALAANAWHERSQLAPGQSCVSSGVETPTFD